MAYPDSGTTLRGDVNVLVTEAAQADSMLIGLKVFPAWNVPVRSGQWPRFRLTKGELLNADATKRTPGGSYGRVTRAYENDNYTVEDYGQEEVVDDTYRADVSRFFQAEVQAGKMCMRSVMIGHEVRVAAQVMNASNFTATAAAVNYTEANIATINLVLDVSDAVTRLNNKGVIPNTIVMSKALFSRVRRSTLFLSQLRGIMGNNADRLASAEDVAAVFANEGITQVLIGRMPKNNANKGATYSATPIWGNTYIWVGYVAGGDPMAGGAGRTCAWDADGGLLVSESYRDEARRSDIIRVRQSVDEKAVDLTAGELITTSYS
jgi:hypothetical protein